jgi:hypothetical protein
MMEVPGSRRRVGFALLLSAAVMAALAALMFAQAIPVAAGSRVILSSALVAAAIVDASIAIVVITQHAG